MKIVNPDTWKDYILKEANYTLPDDCSGGIAVDCGCNIGDFELNNKDRFSHYYCFDVCQENLDLMHQYLKDHPEINYTCFKRACYWSDSQQIPVYAYEKQGRTEYFRNSGDVGIVLQNTNQANGWFKRNQIDTVKSISFESILHLVGGHIQILKVDIEGAEYDFLLDADLSCVDYILIEIHGSRGGELIEYLNQTHFLLSNKKYFKPNIHYFRNKNLGI